MAEAVRVSAVTPNANGPGDRELVAASRNGEVEAFGLLVERHQDRLFTLAYRLTGDREEAADAVQEAYLKAWRALGRFKGESAFYTWIFRILVNEVRSRIRFKAVRPVARSLEGGNPADGGNDGAGLTARLVAAAKDPLAEASREERRRFLERALGQLEPSARELIVLRDIEGRDYAEIAEILDCPRGTVKSRLHRARHALRALLRPLLEPEEEAR